MIGPEPITAICCFHADLTKGNLQAEVSEIVCRAHGVLVEPLCCEDQASHLPSSCFVWYDNHR